MGLWAKLKNRFSKKSSHGMIPSPLSEAQFLQSNYRAAATQGYSQNVYVFRAIQELATAIAAIPWLLFNTSTDKEIEDHPILNLIRHPNPRMSGSTFFEWVMSYYLLAGNSYILGIPPTTGENAGRPMELWPIRPDRVKRVEGGWKIRKDNGDFSELIPEDMMLHLKTFNPLDENLGLSPILVAARSIVQSNESKRWNVAMLQNNARPTGGFFAEGNLREDQIGRLREEVNEHYAGPDNARKPFLGEGGLTWQAFGMTPAEMDWMEGQKLSAREIALVFGVPPELIGDSSNKTYSNYKEARRALYEDTVQPLSIMLRDGLNVWLVPKWGENLRLIQDIDNVAALQEDLDQLYKRANDSNFLTINE